MAGIVVRALAVDELHSVWTTALAKAGGTGVHFHDLRHTGNTLAPTGGATTRELMNRMGHSTVRAAMIYQHLVGGRDEVIAEHVDQQIRKAKGTTARPDGDKDGKNKIE